jgi:predicted deacylase
MRIGNVEIAAGSKRSIAIPVTTGLHGGQITLWCHVARGAAPGPVVTLLSTLHGVEWFYVELLRRVFEQLDPRRMAGSVIVVPVANPPAMALRTRNTPDDGDSPDLNRIFPGARSWTSDQLVRALTDEILSQTTHLLDFHRGSWGSAVQNVLIGDDYADDALVSECERLALVFGSPIIRRAGVMNQQPGPQSAMAYTAATFGAPALAVEWGGPGFGPDLESRWTHSVTVGIGRVMADLGIVEGAPARQETRRQLIYQIGRRVNPSASGLLLSRFGGDCLGGPVSRGDLLGTVISPYTFEILEELRAPCSGALFYVARDYPVRPGDWAFGIASTDEGRHRWVDVVAVPA